jgi:hypothetical protein
MILEDLLIPTNYIFSHRFPDNRAILFFLLDPYACLL